MLMKPNITFIFFYKKKKHLQKKATGRKTSPTEDLEPSLARACSRSAVQATCKQKKNEWSTFFPTRKDGFCLPKKVNIRDKHKDYSTNRIRCINLAKVLWKITSLNQTFSSFLTFSNSYIFPGLHESFAVILHPGPDLADGDQPGILRTH